MDAYDGGSNARRQPGAPSEPGDAPEPQRPEGADGAERTQVPGEPAPPSPPRAQSPAPDREPADVPPAAPDRYAEPTDTRPSAPAAIRQAAALAPAEAAAAPAPYGAPHPPTGVAALSLRYQIGVALALAVAAVAVCVHIGMVFLHVAPQNTVSKQHGRAVDDWVYPEFEQNWKLFAPNPLQLNIAVQVRARISSADGGSRTTGWYDLSAQDGRAIDGNLLPSHTQQNELRRSWDLFVATHDADNRPVGLRGALSETYLRRIVVLRLQRDDATARGDVLVSVQVRSRTTNVPPPKWSEEKVSVQPVYRELPWWAVTADDTEGSAR
ncbi:DUF5819 family protein [Streptomyces canus]|uniref:DUF5819 family protein n=1 Tax=Streptomyces canus TaxID=58343 RepID=UPI00224EB1CD|nr:DUF5819 family protein [Streptomyces canus]MCX4858790.1 DUF5819 family protein [Streptomyces canus]